MKRLLFAIIIFMFMGGFAIAKDPEYEVTIHIVYNSIPVHEITNLMRDQLREHKDACKVEVKIKKVETGITSYYLIDNTATNSTLSYTDDGDTASD